MSLFYFFSWYHLAIGGITALAFLWFVRRKKFRETLPLIDPTSKAIFVTGCDSGIGFQSALLFHRLGFVVFAGCLFPDGDGAKELERKTSDRLHIIGLDVTSDKSVQAAFEVINGKEGSLWAIVNNAGICVLGYFEWFSWNQIQKTIDINFVAQMRILRTFLPLVRKAKGRIVTISSITTSMSFPGSSVYTASKCALEGLHETLRTELQDLGVKVVIIQPGNYSKCTNIMKTHKKDRDEQWNHMNSALKERDEDAFNAFHESIDRMSVSNQSSRMDFQPLLTHMKEAVLSSNPQPRYFSADWKETTFVRMIRLFPIAVRVKIIASFVRKSYKLSINQ